MTQLSTGRYYDAVRSAQRLADPSEPNAAVRNTAKGILQAAEWCDGISNGHLEESVAQKIAMGLSDFHYLFRTPHRPWAGIDPYSATRVLMWIPQMRDAAVADTAEYDRRGWTRRLKEWHSAEVPSIGVVDAYEKLCDRDSAQLRDADEVVTRLAAMGELLNPLGDPESMRSILSSNVGLLRESIVIGTGVVMAAKKLMGPRNVDAVNAMIHAVTDVPKNLKSLQNAALSHLSFPTNRTAAELKNQVSKVREVSDVLRKLPSGGIADDDCVYARTFPAAGWTYSVFSRALWRADQASLALDLSGGLPPGLTEALEGDWSGASVSGDGSVTVMTSRALWHLRRSRKPSTLWR